jgi:chemotaxis protein methyltransferase CheR
MAGQLRLDSPTTVIADELETVLFLRALEDGFGANFLGFGLGHMHDKLTSYVSASGVESISALQGRALRDHSLAAEIIRALNASTGPRQDVFRLMAFRCAVLPLLRSAPWPAVWVADCASVDVPLLLLAVLAEQGLAERTRVFVTSGVEQALEDMRMRPVSHAEVERLQALHLGSGGNGPLHRYLREHGAGFVLDPASAGPLSWHVHHIGSDASFREFDAVVAPRPFGEYNDSLRARALRLFSESLSAFGVLQLNDMQSNRVALDRAHLEPVLGEYGVYRKTGISHTHRSA